MKGNPLDSHLLVVCPHAPQAFDPPKPCVVSMVFNYGAPALIVAALRRMHHASDRITRHPTIDEARASALTYATLYNLNVYDVELCRFTRHREE